VSEDVLVRQKGGNMKKKIFFIGVVFLILIGIGLSNTVEENYSNALKAIDEWVQSIPTQNYHELNTNELFQYKLKIENTSYENEYLVYKFIYDNIDDNEFIYEKNIYNKKSLIYYMLKSYVSCYKEHKEEIINPSEMLQLAYDEYTNSNNEEEQINWLAVFMEYISFYGGSYKYEKDFIDNLSKNSYTIVIELVNTYMLLSNHLLETNEDVVMNIGYYFSKTGIFASFANLQARMLNRLVEFSETWHNFLKQENKDRIVSYMLEYYPDADQTVKIYSLLNTSQE